MSKQQILKLFFIMVSLAPIAQIQGELLEINNITEVNRYVAGDCRDRVVFFNITGTLYEPSNTLSEHQWREYFSKRVKEIVPDSAKGEELINRIKNAIVQDIPKKPVEEVTPALVANLQQRKIPVFGITRKQMAPPYADNFGLITSKHLRSIGIDLEKTLEYSDPVKKESDNYSLAYGMIFTNGKPVAPSLISFLENNDYTTSEIVMVDNTKASLEEVAAALGSKGIAFTGLRYGAADAQKASFNPTLGTIEFLAFMNEKKIMPDEEAVRILSETSEVDYQARLDDLIKKLIADYYQ